MLFSDLFARLFASPGPPLEAPSPDLQQELEATLRQLRAEAARMERSAAPGSAAERPRQEKAWRETREQARQRLAKDITQAHRRLGTGLQEAEVERLRAELPALWPQLEGLECRLEVHVLDFLFHRVGELPWARLAGLVQGAGLSWPVAPELTHGRDPESLALVLGQHQAEVRAAFLQQTPKACADLMAG